MYGIPIACAGLALIILSILAGWLIFWFGLLILLIGLYKAYQEMY